MGSELSDVPFIPAVTAQDAYDERMATQVPALYKTTHERLACELALDLDEPEDIFGRYGYTTEQAVDLLAQPGFKATIDRIGKEIRESGLSFKTKVRAAAEELLADAFHIATDPLAPTAERVKLIMWHAKLAGHEPTLKDEKGAGSGGLNLQITFAGQAPQTVVSHQPQLIEQEAG